jgi:hypothetical protein
MPQIVGLMVFVITMASVQTLWSSGWTLQTARYCRGALDFPLAFFLGANMVTSEGRARKLVGVLLAGALLAALQHIFVAANIWWTKSLDMKTYYEMRTIGFWAGCMPSAFLIAATSWKPPRRIAAKALYGVAGLSLLATLFLNQTRSLWISTGVATLFVLALFKRRAWMKYLVTSLVCILLLSFAFGCLCRYVFPGLDVLSIMANRADDLLHNRVHTGTRARSFNVEMREWCDGTLIFGRGLAYFDTIETSDDPSKRIAFSHLGYVTYLSQLGMIGFVVYGLCLPLGVLRSGWRLWHNGESTTLRYVALLGTASIICLSILFSMSGHFLLRGYEPAGVLYGAMWVLVKRSGDARGM